MIRWWNYDMRSCSATDLILGTSSGSFIHLSSSNSETHCQTVPMIPNSLRFYKLTHSKCAHTYLVHLHSSLPSLFNCSQHYIYSSLVCSGDFKITDTDLFKRKNRIPNLGRLKVKFCLHHHMQLFQAAAAHAPAAAPSFPAAPNSAYGFLP